MFPSFFPRFLLNSVNFLQQHDRFAWRSLKRKLSNPLVNFIEFALDCFAGRRPDRIFINFGTKLSKNSEFLAFFRFFSFNRNFRLFFGPNFCDFRIDSFVDEIFVEIENFSFKRKFLHKNSKKIQ